MKRLRVACAGGGPAGLYGALLYKKSAPESEVTVFERNPRGATYGWGVVFSDRTLTSFREADNKSYRQIVDRFVIWDAIDVRLSTPGSGGDTTVVRAGGQVFSGIARKSLLAILTGRCEELGVRVRFDREFDPGAVDSYDVVLATDGVNSSTRGLNSDSFVPHVRDGNARYIWFGTTRPLDAFTFIFRTTEHGLFQAHAYPFAGSMSTFIVECSEEAWRAAGLADATTEESIAFCEKVFAEDLRGHGLMSNNSRWISFPSLTCRRWQHHNVALIGDAAHTAHFSIGSGTKLAMEDAIAMSNALDTHADVPGALADYELERKPFVERFQEAARQSQAYFESTARFQHLEPEQFVFHLLTRSGRIDYPNLRIRDPALIEGVDRRFARRVTGNDGLVVAPPPGLAPMDLGRVRLANRVVLEAPAAGRLNGVIDDDSRAALRRATRSGAGLVLTSEIAVSPRARVELHDPGLWSDDQVGALSAALEEAEAPVGARLNHGGRRGATESRRLGVDRPLRAGAWPLQAPSEIAYGANTVPIAMTEPDLDEVLSDFVGAARNAQSSGFALLVIEMARGYLLGSFISPLTNRRIDAYGGEPEARLRYPLEVFDAVRKEWNGPLGASVCADDWERGGATVDDAVKVVAALVERGCDLIEVTAGMTTPGSKPRLDPYYLTTACERIRNACGVVTLVGGDVPTLDRVHTIVAGARSDLCLLRPHP